MLWFVQRENDLTDDKYVGRFAHHWIMLIATGEWYYLMTLAVAHNYLFECIIVIDIVII